LRKLKVALIIIAVLIVAIICGVVIINHKLQQLAETNIPNIDLKAIADGMYTGSYSSFPVAAEVEVRVIDHQIVSIDLIKHQNGKGGAAEAIPGLVVDSYL